MVKNLNDALCKTLDSLMSVGSTVRNERTNSELRELMFCDIVVENPVDRIMSLNSRNNNIVAQIAETLWVIMGSNEIKYLSPFLPRAIDYSDDKETWRSGYGTRIRGNKILVDQLKIVIDNLKADPTSRQEYFVIPRPEMDRNIKTLDHACSQLVNFLVREGKLHMKVSIRSNDVLWGFSHINYFEFSFFQEMMAGILGLEVGVYEHSAVSMHIYDKHYETAKKILSSNEEYRTEFDYDKHVNPSEGITSLTKMDELLSQYRQWLDCYISGDNKVFLRKHYEAIAWENNNGLFNYVKIPMLWLIGDYDFAMKEIEDLKGAYLYEALMSSKFFYVDGKQFNFNK